MPQVVKAHFCIQIAIGKCFSVLFVKSCSGKYSAVSGVENIFGRYVKKTCFEAFAKATDWCPADLGYFRGGGYSSHFKTQAVMPMTMIRVNIIKGLGPVIQIAEGYTATLPTRCTTSPTRTSTARTPGPHSAQRTSRARTTEPAPPTARCISKMKIKSSVRETGRNFLWLRKAF